MSEQTSVFLSLGINSKIVENLEKKGITVPTPIQEAAIPPALKGEDVIGIAETGTGKTFAFGLPMIEYLMANTGRGLILVPTRELALQVEEAIRPFARILDVKTVSLIGGASMRRQISQLTMRPRIIVATPGRLIDHMQQKTLNLRDIGMLVLDEADRMLDMGFAPQIERVLEQVPETRQTMLFSATMPDAIASIAERYMRMPIRVEVARAGTPAEKISQEILLLHREDKMKALSQILNNQEGRVLVFSRTKHNARKMAIQLQREGIKAGDIHSNLTTAQRRRALEMFTTGHKPVLVATDIAARGVDVKDVRLVINFDLPDNPDDYVHRIGRTGRAGATGHAISFVTSEDRRAVRSIEQIIQRPLPLSAPLEGIETPKLRPESGRSSGGRGGRSYGRRPAYGRSSSSGSSRSSGGYGGNSRPAFGRSPSAGGTSRPSFGRSASPTGGASRPSFGRSASSTGGNSRPAFGRSPSAGGRPSFGRAPQRSSRPAGAVTKRRVTG